MRAPTEGFSQAGGCEAGRKPRIGVSCVRSAETWGCGGDLEEFHYVGRRYVDAVRKSGGIPLLLPVVEEEPALASAVEGITKAIDGLLLSGGGDVGGGTRERKMAPTLFGQQPTRYLFEKELLLCARRKGMPVLGICRGFQMIVEVLGGRLAPGTVKGHRQLEAGDRASHGLVLSRGTEAYRVLETERMRVNSFHVQSVAAVPEGFVVSGLSDDGVIEFIESSSAGFLWGVQFHPEEMYDVDEKARRIIGAFVEKAGAYGKSHSS